MLGLRARTAGRQPSELLPPIENELAESDFNAAVTLRLHLFERKRDHEEREWGEWRERVRNRELAYMTALARAGGELPEIPPPGELSPVRAPETVQIVVDGERRTVPAPRPGAFYDAAGNLVGRKPARRDRTRACDPHVFVDGQCRGCDLRNDGGVLRYGPDPVECDEHEIEGGKCHKCGGWAKDYGVTKPTPRVLGRCEHERFQVRPEGGVRCLDCGETGY